MKVEPRSAATSLLHVFYISGLLMSIYLAYTARYSIAGLVLAFATLCALHGHRVKTSDETEELRKLASKLERQKDILSRELAEVAD